MQEYRERVTFNLFTHSWWEFKLVQLSWESVWGISKLKNFPKTQLYQGWSSGLQMFYHRDTCASMFIDSLFIIARKGSPQKFQKGSWSKILVLSFVRKVLYQLSHYSILEDLFWNKGMLSLICCQICNSPISYNFV